MLSALNATATEFLVVGAYAMAAHGCPRATGDIDLWVRPSPENAKRVWKAISDFGAPTSQMDVEDFMAPDVVYQIGVAPQRIDLLTSISGVDFESAWSNRVKTQLDNMTVYVISKNDLIQNKRVTGRSKDLADIEVLMRQP